MHDPIRTRAWAQQCLAEFDDAESGLMKAALALAADATPTLDIDRLTATINEMVMAASDAFTADLPESLGDAVALLNQVVLDDQGFSGDLKTPEDPENACMRGVLERRRGLSAALGVLYIHCARALDLEATAINFPDHVFVRLSHAGESCIVDPYHGGMQHGAAGLRAMLKAIAGPDRELTWEDYRPIDDRALLLRLQLERKHLLVKAGDSAGAARAISGLLALDPTHPELFWEQGILLVHSGDSTGGLNSLQRYLSFDGTLGNREKALRLVRTLVRETA